MTGIEIERKFLVKDDGFKAEAVESHHLVQGYICRESGRTVRVRVADDRAYLTIKGRSSDSGMSRLEWETEIPVADALSLLSLCQGGTIDKTRYIVPASAAASSVCRHSDRDADSILRHKTPDSNDGCISAKDDCAACGESGGNPAIRGRKWEVDEFHGDNEGLVVAEIELGSEDEPFGRPSWLGEEVTGESRYYNSMLSECPCTKWMDAPVPNHDRFRDGNSSRYDRSDNQ